MVTITVWKPDTVTASWDSSIDLSSGGAVSAAGAAPAGTAGTSSAAVRAMARGRRLRMIVTS
jgi:hypothetical protein